MSTARNMQNACMPVSMTIRDIPDEVRDALAARASRAGQSLQEHVRGQADAPTEACTGGQHVSGPNEVPTHFAQHGRTPMAVDQS